MQSLEAGSSDPYREELVHLSQLRDTLTQKAIRDRKYVSLSKAASIKDILKISKEG